MTVRSAYLARWSIIVLFVTMLIPKPVAGWDAGGHELVATMAYAKLNPKAQKEVTEFAREMGSPGQTYDAASIACWMDDVRKSTTMPYHGQFAGWHYIDIGVDPGGPVLSLVPGDDNELRGNVVQGLKRAVVVLQGGTDPYIKSKAMACAIAMHLVGDIHQPLHCATKYFYSQGELHQDLGGNKEDVINGPPGDAKFNLHAFWDSAWRASFDEASGRVVLDDRFADEGVHDPESLRALAETLAQQPLPAGTDLETHIEQWARESNGLARDVVYPGITATDNKKLCRLSRGYVAKANGLARQRIELAADRLAVLLNETLGAEGAMTPPPSYPAGPPSQSY